MPVLAWWQELDLDWEVELLLLDDAARCGTCGSSLNTSGTCSLCDRPRYRLLSGVCSCECMTCALGQHCGWCRTGTHHEEN